MKKNRNKLIVTAGKRIIHEVYKYVDDMEVPVIVLTDAGSSKEVTNETKENQYTFL